MSQWSYYPPSKEGFYRWMSLDKEKNEVEIWQFLFKRIRMYGRWSKALVTDAGEDPKKTWQPSGCYRGIWQGPYKTEKRAKNLSSLDFTSAQLIETRNKGLEESRITARTSRVNHTFIPSSRAERRGVGRIT